MSNVLSSKEIEDALVNLPGWSFEQDKLSKRFSFANFREAIAFIVRLSFEAEQLNHHPDFGNTYKFVTLTLTTHDCGNKVTDKDVALAQKIEQIAGGKG